MDLEGEGRVLESQLQTGQHTGHWLHPRLLTSVTSLIWSLYNDTQRLCVSQHPSLIHVICADVRKVEGRSSSYLKEIKQLTWAQFAGNRILYFVGNIFKEFVLTRVNCCTGSLCHLLVNTLNCDHTGLELLERDEPFMWTKEVGICRPDIFLCFTMNGFYVMFAKEGDKWAVKNLFEDVRAPSELVVITKHWVT